MSASGLVRISLLAAVTAAAVHTAWAQHVMLDAPGILGQKKAPAAPPPPRAQPTVWPRLDPGAVLCRTADDLERYAANMAARASGGDTQAADCQIISQPTGIQIVSRQGLGRTEVKLSTSDNMIGWTDVWLPDKAPVTR
jgi:hypothetical protein